MKNAISKLHPPGKHVREMYTLLNPTYINRGGKGGGAKLVQALLQVIASSLYTTYRENIHRFITSLSFDMAFTTRKVLESKILYLQHSV